MKKAAIHLLRAMIVILSLSFISHAQELLDTTGQEKSSGFFLKEMTGAIHSITYDNDGNMIVGSLGKKGEVGVKGRKQIFKITPDRQISEIESLTGLYITALAYDSKNNLYIIFADTNHAYKFGKFSNHVLSHIFDLPGEHGGISIDKADNVYFGQYVYYADSNKIATTKPYDYPADDLFNHYYSHRFGGKELIRYTKSNSVVSEPDTILKNCSFLSGFVCDKSGNAYIHEYNNGDYIIKISPDNQVEKFKVDVQFNYDPRIIIEGYITKIILGNKLFGENYAYLTNWSGDIIKVDLRKPTYEINTIPGDNKIIELPTSINFNGGKVKTEFSETPSWLKPYLKNTDNKQHVVNRINIEGLKEGSYKTQVKVITGNTKENEYSYFVILNLYKPHPAQDVQNLKKGLKYEYYEDTSFTIIPDFTKMKPQKTGITNNIDLSVKNRDTLFAVVYNGYINIPQTTLYTFYLTSDDGSKLYIDDELYINNDGLHASQEKYKGCCLEKGLHKIRVEYMQGKQGYGLGLSYEATEAGITKRALSENELFY